MKHIVYLFIIICLLSVIVSNNKKIEPTIITKTDTITLYDTITIEKPIPKYIKTKPDTIYLPSINDSVAVDREIKLYKDSTYECQVSGIDPFLDYIKVFPTQTTIYKEKVLEIEGKRPLIEFKPSIGVGYLPLSRKIEPYIGYGITINF